MGTRMEITTIYFQYNTVFGKGYHDFSGFITSSTLQRVDRDNVYIYINIFFYLLHVFNIVNKK